MAAARSRLSTLMAGMAVGPIAVLSYVIFTGALGKAAEDLIWFASQRYPRVQYVPFATFATWLDAVTVAVFPAAVLLTAATFAMKAHAAVWRDSRGRVALALALVGLLGSLPRPDIVHLNFAAPLACPLVALGVTAVAGRLREMVRITVTLLVIGLCVAGVGYATKRRMDVMAGPLEVIATPRGAIVRRPDPWTTDFALLMWHLDRLPVRDPVFFYPYLPMLPYLTARPSVGPLDFMLPGYTTPEQFGEMCTRVVHGAQWLVLDRSWSDPRKLQRLFPTMTDYDPPEKRAFEGALARTFDVMVHRSVTFELRRRGPGSPDALCPPS
jgi:hypothetical protein